MVRSLAVVVACVLGVLWLTPRPEVDPVRVIDYSQTLDQARGGFSYPVFAPVGLEGGWRPTSARSERLRSGALTWHIGFVTPASRYAAVEQSDEPAQDLLTRLGARGPSTGTVSLGGQSWERREADGKRALSRVAQGSTLVVAGDAGWVELEWLAGALRSE